MVKKINGKKPPSSTGTDAVERSKAVDSASGVKDVKEVQSAEGQQGAERIRRPTRPMTPEERDHLFRLIHEEADKMFGEDGLPIEKRETVESAVRMTVDAGILDEDDEEAAS